MARDSDSHSQQSEFSYLMRLGERRGRNYNAGVRLDPTANNVESFAVVLFFQRRDGLRVVVARVDNSPHDDGQEQDIHIDRYYRKVGADIKEYRQELESWEDAVDFIELNWKTFADRYYERHEDKPRADGANT